MDASARQQGPRPSLLTQGLAQHLARWAEMGEGAGGREWVGGLMRGNMWVGGKREVTQDDQEGSGQGHMHLRLSNTRPWDRTGPLRLPHKPAASKVGVQRLAQLTLSAGAQTKVRRQSPTQPSFLGKPSPRDAH